MKMALIVFGLCVLFLLGSLLLLRDWPQRQQKDKSKASQDSANDGATQQHQTKR